MLETLEKSLDNLIEHNLAVNIDDKQWQEKRKKLNLFVIAGSLFPLFDWGLLKILGIPLPEGNPSPEFLLLVIGICLLIQCIIFVGNGIFYPKGNYEHAQNVVKMTMGVVGMAMLVGVFFTNDINRIVVILLGIANMAIYVGLLSLNKFVFERMIAQK